MTKEKEEPSTSANEAIQEVPETRPASPGVTPADVAQMLASQSFSVGQLVNFYCKYAELGTIGPTTKTWQVVRDIVIPETSAQRCRYMDVMPGGAMWRGKLVSHWWGANFRDIVLCILRDATGLDEAECARLLSKKGQGLHKAQLELQYWLCIFAVNQHVSICGTCGCGSQDYASRVCASCGKAKMNPCDCGTKKHTSGDPRCQVDKFDLVMGLMDGLVVALDPRLETLSRVWVVAEIGQAMHRHKPLRFVGELADEFKQGLAELRPVQDCSASDPRDKENILRKIKHNVGIRKFDRMVSKAVLGGVRELALLQAARGGSEEAAIQLLEAGTDPNTADAAGRTPLIWAAERNLPFLAQAALDARADPNIIDRSGETALMMAAEKAENGGLEVVTRLLDCGLTQPDVASRGWTALMLACKKGNTAIAKALLDARADPNAAYVDGESVLFIAEESDDVELVRALLDAGASTSAVHNGWTVLMGAVANGRAEVAKALLDARADPNVSDPYGETALICATKGDDTELAMALLDARADPNAADRNGDTALLSAHRRANTRLARHLLALGADSRAYYAAVDRDLRKRDKDVDRS